MTPAANIPAWGDLLTRASVWLALLGYLAGPLAALTGHRRTAWQRTARSLYTAGLACFLIHVVAAFHFYYGWSPAVALAETARQTFDAVAGLMGMDAGRGPYVVMG